MGTETSLNKIIELGIFDTTKIFNNFWETKYSWKKSLRV
jgi:hypothetical protein